VGGVVSATVVGDPLARTSQVVEITCGVKDTRVSHPVLGMPGPGRPSADRVPSEMPIGTFAVTSLSFRVPDIPSGTCSVYRTVYPGSKRLEPGASLYVG
jgi:hypothetical protein